jgi:hypothetical protein
LTEALGRPVGRGIVEDDKFEVIECLAQDAFHRRIKVRERIVDRHDHADWELGYNHLRFGNFAG